MANQRSRTIPNVAARATGTRGASHTRGVYLAGAFREKEAGGGATLDRELVAIAQHSFPTHRQQAGRRVGVNGRSALSTSSDSMESATSRAHKGANRIPLRKWPVLTQRLFKGGSGPM